MRFDFRDWSPNSLITGTWDEAAARLQVQRLAQTWRPYRVTRIVDESSVIRSFHLQPDDGHAVPAFEAGQHLPIRLRPDGMAPLQRTYTISHAPGDDGLRLSVKREGAASSYLHDQVQVGDRHRRTGPARPVHHRRQGPPAGGADRRWRRHHADGGVCTAPGGRGLPSPPHAVAAPDPGSARRISARFRGELQTLVERAKGAMRLHVVLSTGAAPELTGPLASTC